MSDQNTKMVGPLGPSDIPTGSVPIDVSVADQTLNPTCRGVDFLTAGNIVVVFVDGSSQTVPGSVGTRWSGHIKQITKSGTTATGYALK
jgi:hypothetical protein